MSAALSANEEAQLMQTIEMFEVITQSQPNDVQSLEILKEAYFKLTRQDKVIETSKRIAQAYVQNGQLSSAILEYESILQRFPNDADVRKALADIENKASSFAAPPMMADADLLDKPKSDRPRLAVSGDGKGMAAEIDDGRDVMQKLFVDGKLISLRDFNQYWIRPSLAEPPSQVLEPFIQLLDDKGLFPLVKSLKLLCEKTRYGFLNLEKYDIDLELSRSFPKETCQRWCVMPFDRMSKSVLVATANPFNRQAASELEKATSHRLVWYLTNPVETTKVIRKVYR